MQIEKFLTHLNRNKNLLVYLFEHRDRVVFHTEIEEFCSENTLEVLENFEILTTTDDILQKLIDTIKKYQKALEQEFFIGERNG
jgi:2-phosphoglycerate kinase